MSLCSRRENRRSGIAVRFHLVLMCGLSDCYCRLHKVAFEILPNPDLAYGNPVDDETGFNGGGCYLSCLGESVGLQRSQTNRMAFTAEGLAGFYSAAGQLADCTSIANSGHTSLYGGGHSELTGLYTNPPRSQSALPSLINERNDPDEHRRASISGFSGLQSASSEDKKLDAVFPASAALSDFFGAAKADRMWMQDAGDAGVWTIAGTGEIYRKRPGRHFADRLSRNQSTYFLHSTCLFWRACALRTPVYWLSRLLSYISPLDTA